MKLKHMYKQVLLAVLLIGLFGACNNEAIKSDLYYIMLDKTDTTLNYNYLMKSSREEILELSELTLEGSSPNGCSVRTFEINSLSNNKSDEVELKKGSIGLNGDNPLDRNEEIKKFYKELDRVFSNLAAPSKCFNQSKIYQNLCRELISLRKVKGYNSKRLIIYSDMLENSSLFSFYKNKIDYRDKESLRLAIKSIEEKACVFPNLSGIEIFVISSRNETNDELINNAERFWMYLLDSKGATDIHFDSELKL
jgi:hypothetical protein